MNYEIATRAGFFLAAFLGSAAWEIMAPKRELEASRPFRWANNLGIFVLDTLLLRCCLPILAMDMAIIAEIRRWGLLNRFGCPFGLKLVLGFLFLDLVIYVQHWAFHRVPAFWRFHKVHHTDLDVDVTTGVRFHPLEILLSMAIKLAAVTLIGAHFLAVLAFEVVLNATSLFNHANIRIPGRLERLLRLIVVTPDMHRIHHSTWLRETNSNFGFNLPWWDRIFGTYNHEPQKGHLGMTIGLDDCREWRAQRFFWLLTLPFGKTGSQAPYR